MPRSPEPFTFDAYAGHLALAQEAGYAFHGFDRVRDPAEWPKDRFILLRHDIDYDPRCTRPISRIEAEHGVSATYFFQPNSPYYDLDDAVTMDALRGMLRDGHRLGLHFDATTMEDDGDVVEQVERTSIAWEHRFDAPIDAVSFHMPTHRAVTHLQLPNGRVNTYAPLFHDRLEYVSDSNQGWRGKDLASILGSGRFDAIQVLTHPMWWRETFIPFEVLLQELATRLGISLEDDILTPEQRTRLAGMDGTR